MSGRFVHTNLCMHACLWAVGSYFFVMPVCMRVCMHVCMCACALCLCAGGCGALAAVAGCGAHGAIESGSP